jgi:hypothetical protein
MTKTLRFRVDVQFQSLREDNPGLKVRNSASVQAIYGYLNAVFALVNW